MKLLLIILLSFPVVSFAQQKTTQNVPGDGSFKYISSEMTFINGPVNSDDDYNTMLTKASDNVRLKGNVEFTIGITHIKCDTAIINNDRKSLTASAISITCNQYPVLKGDEIIYDQHSKQAILKGHIKVIDNGVGKTIGKIIYLDFSHESYKVTDFR